MKYGTLFSGVEGFGIGLDAAGMECAFQCEIDDHCQSVLRYRYPEVPKWLDVTEVDPDELPDVDVLAFGSPCQDVSVAGRRAGLDGERSGLFVEAIRIADRLAPDFVLFENVPGLLSSQQGEDFAVVLEGFTGFRPAVPEGGWRSSGWVVGPLRWAVWRVLDTQYFGPPQRRRRVFVVAGARGPCRPEVLLEPESVPWNPPPSREAREGSPEGTAGGAGGEGGVAHTLRGEGCDASEDGTGRGTPLVVAFQHKASSHQSMTPGVVSPALGTTKTPAVLPFDTTQVTSKGNYSRPKPGDPCHQAHGTGGYEELVAGPTIAVPRRLTPLECERLQGWPDSWTRYGRAPDGEIIELKDSPRYRMCGNGVSAPVAEWIGRRIKALAEPAATDV